MSAGPRWQKWLAWCYDVTNYVMLPMKDSTYTLSWKRSIQPRKQRKFRYTAPLHQRQKQMHVHLSAVLRKKYGFRNLQLRVGDKVKICRGRFARKEGRVESVNLKRETVRVAGAEIVKKDGSKVPVPLHPSTLLLVELDLNDRRRKQKVESKSKNPTQRSGTPQTQNAKPVSVENTAAKSDVSSAPSKSYSKSPPMPPREGKK